MAVPWDVAFQRAEGMSDCGKSLRRHEAGKGVESVESVPFVGMVQGHLPDWVAFEQRPGEGARAPLVKEECDRRRQHVRRPCGTVCLAHVRSGED